MAASQRPNFFLGNRKESQMCSEWACCVMLDSLCSSLPQTPQNITAVLDVNSLILGDEFKVLNHAIFKETTRKLTWHTFLSLRAVDTIFINRKDPHYLWPLDRDPHRIWQCCSCLGVRKLQMCVHQFNSGAADKGCKRWKSLFALWTLLCSTPSRATGTDLKNPQCPLHTIKLNAGHSMLACMTTNQHMCHFPSITQHFCDSI